MTASLKMRCGACGKENVVEMATLGARAAEDAAKLTDAALAERYRQAFELAVRRFFPESMQRLPLARVRMLSDEFAVEVGRDVLSVMLRPPE